MQRKTIQLIAGVLFGAALLAGATGCPHKHSNHDDPMDDPSAAVGCASGGGDTIEHKGIISTISAHDGKLRVIDVNTGETVFKGKVDDGEKVTINPATNKIQVGREEHKVDLPNTHTYRLEIR